MRISLPRALACGVVGLAALVAAPGARAQNAAAVTVLRDYVDTVKLPDGSTADWRVTVVYDPATGETIQTMTDAAGRVVDRTVQVGDLTAPSEEEIARAEALVRADPEVAALIAAAANPVVQGGFILVREAGHPCAPGARCLQFDVANVDEAARRVERLRYVVVDLRSGQVVSNNFDPAFEGNVRRPEDAR